MCSCSCCSVPGICRVRGSLAISLTTREPLCGRYRRGCLRHRRFTAALISAVSSPTAMIALKISSCSDCGKKSALESACGHKIAGVIGDLFQNLFQLQGGHDFAAHCGERGWVAGSSLPCGPINAGFHQKGERSGGRPQRGGRRGQQPNLCWTIDICPRS